MTQSPEDLLQVARYINPAPSCLLLLGAASRELLSRLVPYLDEYFKPLLGY